MALPALICFFWDHSYDLHSLDHFSIFHYFKFQEERLTRHIVLDSMKEYFESLFPYFKSLAIPLSRKISPYSASSALRIVESYGAAIDPSRLWRLKAMAFLETKAKTD